MKGSIRRAPAFALALVLVCALAPSVAAAPSPRQAAVRGVAPEARLAPSGSVAAAGGGVIHRYRQRAGALPVLGAEAVVAEPPHGPPLLVADSTRPSSRTTRRARSLGRGRSGPPGGRPPPSACAARREPSSGSTRAAGRWPGRSRCPLPTRSPT